MSVRLKILCVILLFVTWGGFVVLGLAPPEPFIQTVQNAISMFGGAILALINPKE